MFDDFKDKIRRHNSEKEEASSLSPDIIAKLQSQGLDPETVTLAVIPRNLRRRGKRLIAYVRRRMGNNGNLR